MYAANAYSIRQTTAVDAPELRRLAELDSQKPFSGPGLIAETGGVAVAAISLFDGRLVADPFHATAAPAQLLRIRLGALRAYSSAPSLPERLRAAMRPFVAHAAKG